VTKKAYIINFICNVFAVG